MRGDLGAAIDALVRCWREANADEAATLDAMRPGDREKAAARLRGILASSAKLLDPSAAATEAGMKVTRFFQVARAFRQKPVLASLGVRDRLLIRRAPRLAMDAAADRALVIEEIRALLVAEVPPPTEEAMRILSRGRGARFSRTSLLRWWTAERRARPATQIGAALAADISLLDLRRPDGDPWSAAFIVDRGAEAILGGAVCAHDPSAEDLVEAARDAIRRLPHLGLDRARPASSPRIVVGTATLADGISALRMFARLSGDLPLARISEQTRGRVLGRTVRAAAGGRLGRVGLPVNGPGGSAESVENFPVASFREVEALLRNGIDVHQREVARRQAELPASSDPAALDPLVRLLNSIAGRSDRVSPG